MSVAVTSHIVPLVLHSLEQIGEQVGKLTCDEKCALHLIFLQCIEDFFAAFSHIVSGKHQANILLRHIAANHSATAIDIAVGSYAALRHTFHLIGRQRECERCGAIHSRLIGGVIVHIVVIHHIIHLEIVIVGRTKAVAHIVGEIHAPEVVENILIHRAVNETSGGIAHIFVHEARVRLTRIIAA